MASRLSLVFIAFVAGCPSNNEEVGSDGGMGDDGSMQPDGNTNVCTPACVAGANEDAECTVLETCESSCETGFSRCGDSCVAESVTQCGAGCSACPSPANGTGTCSDGVCGVTCNAGFVPSEGYSVACVPFASEVVAPEDMGGYMPQVAVDSAGAVHLAYYRSDEHQLVYAKNTVAGLTRETAKAYWSSGGGARFEIALGAKGPLILYTYPNSLSGLYLAEKRSTGWSHSKVVGDTTPIGFGFATDRAGRAHACFTTSAGLSYGIRHGDKWTITPVGDLDGKGACAITTDHDGLPHIAYVRSTDHDLAYAKGDANGTFTTTMVDAVGFVGAELSIALSADGTPQIGYYASDNKDLRWATKAGGAWTTQSVSTGYLVGYPRLAIGSSGPVMTWFDYGQYRVMIATKNGAAWTKQVFDDVTGGYGAIAPAPDGSVWITTGDGSVLLHNIKNGQGASYGIDFDDVAGSDIAVLHRSPTQPVMIYDNKHDNVQHVEVATKVTGGWSRTELATPGYGAVAALDGGSKIHVAYQTGTGLSYAIESGGAFAIETLAATASQPSIAVDGTTPKVAYVQTVASNQYALVLATRGASGWTPQTIGAAAAYGVYTKPIVRIVSGVVHVLWYDSVAKATNYASSADGFTKVTVETNADSGHDLWVSPAGVPHACTFRKGTSWPDQKYATRSGTTWSSVFVANHGSALNSGRCAIRGDANGTINIARSLVYGAGLGELVLTTLGTTTTHTVLQDDFYSAGMDMSLGANGVEVAATGKPYDGSGNAQNRVRWAHR